MKITIDLNDTLIESTVRSIMDNFPEASRGSELSCIGWHYEPMNFTFKDSEGKTFLLGKEQLIGAFPLIFTDKWPKGCTQPPNTTDAETWENWLCQCDAIDFDAFVQLACLGEVIYG